MSFVRPLPIYRSWCKVFEEAIKFIFCYNEATAESPDLANQIEQFFSFSLQGGEFWMGSKNLVLMRLAFWTRNTLSQE